MSTTSEDVKYTTLFIDKNDKIATIHLNRPERLNALSETMRAELVAACDELAVDSSVSVVILKGEGRAFCSGADVKNAGIVDSGSELHPGDTAADWLRAQREQLFLWKVWDLPKPVIAQVQGYALGLGSLLMTMCDLVVIAEDARVGNARITMGAGMIGTKYAWAVGLRRAKWLDLLPGWRITGKEAVEWGWANLAVPAEDLDDEVAALAEQLAKVPLTHLMFRKVSLNRVWEEMGFRNSIAAGIDFDPLAHKSTEGLEMENRVGRDGFINVGREMYTSYPARHDRA
jgi:enoyl-CoA hydratase